jgi:hypothetical protein
VHKTRADVLAALEGKRGTMSVEEQADKIGILWSYLYKMRGGKRPPNQKVLEYLEMRKVELYEDDK